MYISYIHTTTDNRLILIHIIFLASSAFFSLPSTFLYFSAASLPQSVHRSHRFPFASFGRWQCVAVDIVAPRVAASWLHWDCDSHSDWNAYRRLALDECSRPCYYSYCYSFHLLWILILLKVRPTLLLYSLDEFLCAHVSRGLRKKGLPLPFCKLFLMTANSRRRCVG